MNQSSTWKWVLAIVVIVLVIWGLSSWGGKNNPADTAISLEETTELIVAEPLADDVVESPLAIEGDAAGSWYFDGSFPIKLVDDQGNVLGESLANTEADDTSSTTEEMLPFTAIIEFDAGDAEFGDLLFGKANPSGLADAEEWVKLPVRFAVLISEATTSDEEDEDADAVAVTDDEDDTTSVSIITEPVAPTPSVTSGTITVKAFFAKAEAGDGAGAECSQVGAVTRSVPKTVAVARAALNELLKGPATGEISQGWLTSLPPGVRLQSLTINNSVARADFSKELKAAGSCRVTSIRAQITETLKQFKTISTVIISVDGDVAGALQP